MAGGKFKKPQRGGGRNFSRRIEAVHKKHDDQSGLENLSEPEHSPEDHLAPESDSEEESEMEDEDPTNNKLDMSIPIEMSRKEREAAEKEAAKQRYWKLHLEGKTDQAKSDMARLAIIRKEREESAAKRLAEAKAKEDAVAAKIGLTPSMKF
ncbi:hypothetical protein BGZ76_008625 [Entomortierella beljakovae]|nr:hypothetical protein BGZ76_008625 [Entomortierella beljakovae]